MEIKSIILYLQNGNIEITDLSKEIKDNKNIYSFFFNIIYILIRFKFIKNIG